MPDLFAAAGVSLPETASPEPETPLSDDILEGAQEIATFVWGNETPARKAYRAIGPRGLPVFHIGNRIHARKSTLIAWIQAQEPKLLPKNT
jgi:hypothetical protein